MTKDRREEEDKLKNLEEDVKKWEEEEAERCFWVFNTPVSYSGGTEFDFWQGRRLSSLSFL
jgi:hypothetical protein